MPNLPICSICCDYYTPDSIIKTTKCGHIFHRQCILRWLRNKPNCPECRKFGPVLYRVYLNFSDSSETEETTPPTSKTISNTQETQPTQQQIENLIMKLSLEEAKNKDFEKYIQELERKLREQSIVIKTKDEELQNAIKSCKEMVKKFSLEEYKQTRHDVQEIEKLLKKEMATKKLQTQKPTSSINVIGRNLSVNNTIKLNTSTSNCLCRSNNSLTNRTKSTVSASTSTSSSLSTSLSTSTLSYPSPTRRVQRVVLPSTTNRSMITRRTVTGNVAFECNLTELI